MKNFLLLVIFLPVINVSASSISAELIMSGGRAWDVEIIKRVKTDQKDSLQLSINGRVAGIPISSVQKINYDINVDIDELMNLKEEREYTLIIDRLKQSLKPYEPYMDILSNLTPYQALLMEMYFLVEDYNKTIDLAQKIQSQSTDENLISSSEIYLVRSLIKSNLADQAETLLRNNGWFENINENSKPEELFILAELMKLKSNYNRAIELVSYIIAFNSQDPEWTQPAELLCAELYTELEMYDSAEEVIDQILLLYPDSLESEKAEQLSLKLQVLSGKTKSIF
jgi:tetratricopeptide (TPR) repeat protein